MIACGLARVSVGSAKDRSEAVICCVVFELSMTGHGSDSARKLKVNRPEGVETCRGTVGNYT